MGKVACDREGRSAHHLLGGSRRIRERAYPPLWGWLGSQPEHYAYMDKLFRPAFIVALLSLTALASAQSVPFVRLGVKGGIQQRELNLGSAFSSEPLGVHGGLYLRIAPPVGMGGQVEVLYTEKNTPVENGEEVTDVRLSYVEVPLFVVFPLGPLDLQFGGYGSKLLSTDLGGLAQQVTEEGVQLSADDLRESDYGLLGGAALNLGRWQAGVRYTYGLCSVDESGDFTMVNGENNRAAQFYLGYALIK